MDPPPTPFATVKNGATHSVCAVLRAWRRADRAVPRGEPAPRRQREFRAEGQLSGDARGPSVTESLIIYFFILLYLLLLFSILTDAISFDLLSAKSPMLSPDNYKHQQRDVLYQSRSSASFNCHRVRMKTAVRVYSFARNMMAASRHRLT